MTIIAISDVHLGFEDCNDSAFDKFLDWVGTRDDVDRLVICGDFLDMWRRDPAGVVFENSDIIVKLHALQPKIKVHYVGGNHDYHVTELKNFGYKLEFSEDLTIMEGNIRHTFKHGYEFDPSQNKIYFNALCYTTDEQGDVISEAWEILMQGKKWLDRIKAFFSREKGRARSEMKRMLTTPKERLKDMMDVVEKNACTSVGEGEILIFGHTHRPFVNKRENVANTGCWVSDAPVQNTYVEIKDGKIALKVFGGVEVTERLEC
jgi:UDP-2,3-diacylglucosamine pyrophosphatase LpxH